MTGLRRRITIGLAAAAVAVSLSLASGAQAATFTVNSMAEPGDGVCNSTQCTLREALDATNANGTSEVDQVTISATGTITVKDGLSVLTPTNVVGPGPGLLTVRRDPTAVTPFVLLQLGAPGGITISISGMGVSGSNSSGIGSKYPDTAVNLADLAVFGNVADANGGGIRNAGTMTIERSTIGDANFASGAGGGIYNSGALTITASAIRGNTAGGGGGGITNTGTLTVINSTISDNRADDFGGGIENGGTTRVSSATIASNEANNDGDAFGDGGGTWNGAGTTTVKNTLYYDNFVLLSGGALTTDDQCSGVPAHTSEGYNLRQTADSGCAGFNAPGDIVNNGFALGPLANNGGPTATRALPAGAAAIDAGNPAAPGSGGGACPATDQRGLFRGGSAGRCDIGAFELGATLPPPPPGPVAAPPVAAKKKCKKAKRRAASAKKKCKKKRTK